MNQLFKKQRIFKKRKILDIFFHVPNLGFFEIHLYSYLECQLPTDFGNSVTGVFGPVNADKSLSCGYFVHIKKETWKEK